MAHGFAWRVCLVACVGVLSFALAHANIDVRGTKVVTEKTVVNRNETPPDGTITRAECARLKGMTFQEVIYKFGLPYDFDRTDAFFDSLHYSLGEDSAAPGNDYNAKECNVYFDTDEHGIDGKVREVSIDV